ncbi:hypothetical protein DRN98_09125 [Methanosarcinales archaeon]|nr:MAG: hypothetical protein DRN98_09125 [Methanosarcinales archaeon]
MEVVVGSDFHCLHSVRDLSVRGDHDDIHIGPLLAGPSQQLHSTHARHANVGQHYIEASLLEFFVGFFPVRCGFHNPLGAFKRFAHAVAGVHLIVNNKYPAVQSHDCLFRETVLSKLNTALYAAEPYPATKEATVEG